MSKGKCQQKEMPMAKMESSYLPHVAKSEQIVKPTQKQQQQKQSFFVLSPITELITCWGMV